MATPERGSDAAIQQIIKLSKGIQVKEMAEISNLAETEGVPYSVSIPMVIGAGQVSFGSNGRRSGMNFMSC